MTSPSSSPSTEQLVATLRSAAKRVTFVADMAAGMGSNIAKLSDVYDEADRLRALAADIESSARLGVPPAFLRMESVLSAPTWAEGHPPRVTQWWRFADLPSSPEEKR